MADVVDEIFGEEITRYPGSTKRIRYGGASSGVRVMPLSDPIFNKDNWGKPTTIEVIPGHTFQFYRPTVFAKILGKSGPTLKFWQQQGFVPKPPFRFRYETTVRNYYDEESILAFLKLLNERGLLYEDRIVWSRHPELPDEIRKAWKKILLEFKEKVSALQALEDNQ